jgi:hypothetical protein
MGGLVSLGADATRTSLRTHEELGGVEGGEGKDHCCFHIGASLPW